MNDWGMSVLEQYPLVVHSTRKIRGALLCDTDQGLYLLQEYRGAQGRLESEYRLLLYLKEQGTVGVDAIVKTKEEQLMAKNEEETGYVLKQWYPWNECNVSSLSDLRRAVTSLARIHSLMQGRKAGAWCLQEEKEQEPEQRVISKPCQWELYRKHNQELRRVRAYLQRKKQKSVLEQLIQKSYDPMYEQALEAQQQMSCAAYSDLECKARAQHDRTHGAYHQHNVLIGAGGTAVVNFERSTEGWQLEDLYHFLRKVMEKQNWNQEIGLRLLGEYSNILPLSQQQRRALGWMIFYPEKYWKQVNFYFNNNKSWIADKNIEKLKKAVEQSSVRTAFANLLIK